MAKTMTASVFDERMTSRQIECVVDAFRSALQKHRLELAKNAAQEGLGVKNIGMRLLAHFRDIVQEASGVLIRYVKVNRRQRAQTLLNALGCFQVVMAEALAVMPRGRGDRAELIYFKPDASVYENGLISAAALAAEYERLGLSPDPWAQIEDNVANPNFANANPNACQWQDDDGLYYYFAIKYVDGERYVYVRRCKDEWDDSWSFAGVSKKFM